MIHLPRTRIRFEQAGSQKADRYYFEERYHAEIHPPALSEPDTADGYISLCHTGSDCSPDADIRFQCRWIGNGPENVDRRIAVVCFRANCTANAHVCPLDSSDGKGQRSFCASGNFDTSPDFFVWWTAYPRPCTHRSASGPDDDLAGAMLCLPCSPGSGRAWLCRPRPEP